MMAKIITHPPQHGNVIQKAGMCTNAIFLPRSTIHTQLEYSSFFFFFRVRIMSRLSLPSALQLLEHSSSYLALACT